MDDLRVEVAAERERGADDGVALGDTEAWFDSIGTDWRRAELADRDVAMLEYVVKLTLRPGEITQHDVEALYAVGFSNTGIHDIVQVTALFGYYNRLADGLGAEDEPEWVRAGTT